jgi:hypothetical protein
VRFLADAPAEEAEWIGSGRRAVDGNDGVGFMALVCAIALAGTGFVVGLARVIWALTDASFRGPFLPRLGGAVLVSGAYWLVCQEFGTHGWIPGALAIAMALGTLYAATSEFRRGTEWWANWDPVIPDARGGGARNRWAFVVLVGIVALSHHQGR